jgi:hypothetical protein
MVISSVARADGASGDLVIEVNGAFTSNQGEAFTVSYEADLTSYNLVPGTLSYSASGPLGTVTSVYGIFPEGAEWQFSGGDVIDLMLFRTPGCGTSPDAECQPEVGPNEIFPAGYTNAQVNAFANGIFEIFPPGPDPTAYFGDVQVSLADDPVITPEPTLLLMLLSGLGLVLLAKRFAY